MKREELAKIKAALDAAENMRHGGFKDGLIAAYDGHAREARAALTALQSSREAVVRECAALLEQPIYPINLCVDSLEKIVACQQAAILNLLEKP